MNYCLLFDFNYFVNVWTYAKNEMIIDRLNLEDIGDDHVEDDAIKNSTQNKGNVGHAFGFTWWRKKPEFDTNLHLGYNYIMYCSNMNLS